VFALDLQAANDQAVPVPGGELRDKFMTEQTNARLSPIRKRRRNCSGTYKTTMSTASSNMASTQKQNVVACGKRKD